MSAAHPKCPISSCKSTSVKRHGYFRIKRTNSIIRRYRCKTCNKTFSSRTTSPDYRHKKRDLNAPLLSLLAKGVTLRDCARFLGITYKNTYRKFLWLGDQAEEYKKLLKLEAQSLFFDEMETIEHTKCKPLGIFLAVNEEYLLLEAKVAKMPAKGRLAKFSVKKYGKRIDERPQVAEECFCLIKEKLKLPPKEIFSDAKPSYFPLVTRHFPKVPHYIHSRADKDRHRDRIHENHHKKRFDPMFRVNQRCAKLRAQIKRLARRSWCTTKKPENLQRHLNIFLISQHLS
jgi:transposase-like protein